MRIEPVLLGVAAFWSTTARAGCDDRVVGHVTGPDGEPVAGARVELGERNTLTTDDGRFVLREVCPEPAELHVHHMEYAGWSQTIAFPVDHVDVELLEDEYAIVVEAPAFSDRDPHARTTVEGAALERTRGQDLAEAIASVPGVTVLRTSGDATRPMIRGQYGRRLLLLFDGMRHESQKWGDEHAPEVDPFAADSISVIRGAAGVRYGPDAVGGVVLMESPDLRREAGVGGRVDTVMVSNGGRGVAAGRLDVSDGEGLAMRLEANTSRGSSLRAPDHVLGNTASRTDNAALTVGWTQGDFELEAGVRHHAFQAGICYCARSSSPSELQAALLAKAPVNADLWEVDRTIDRPRQEVSHDTLYARAVGYTGLGTVEVRWNTQLNRRREYDQVRDAIEGPQYDFSLRTHTLDAGLLHDSVHLGELATLQGSVGLTGTLQENVYRGLPLVPNHRAYGFGAYVAERLSLGHALIEAGARVDHQTRQTYLTEEAFGRHVRRGTLDPGTCEESADVARCPRAWTAGTLTLGGIWHDDAERFEVRLDLSSASRFPNGDELFLNGAAPTQPVYGLGDPGLRPEVTWSASPTLGVALDRLRAEVSVYANAVDDYIVFGPALEDGSPHIDVTAQGAFPRYETTQTDAWFAGIEGQITVPERWFEATVSGAVVRAGEWGTGDPLPMIPPDRAGLAVRLTPPDLGRMEGASVGLSVQGVAKQTRWDSGTDLGPPPDGYVLLGASAGLPVELPDGTLRIGIEVDNLTNARVRSYTSLLRYFADDPGRDVRVRVGFEF